MKFFNVYPLMDIELVKGEGCWVYDSDHNKYLDLYGGHAVISVGHTHPHYVERIKNQLDQIGFYSNSVINKVQQALAAKLGELSGYDDYQLFFCNSGAEATENALKIASFHTGKSKFISFKRGFHGRTSRAVAVTDSPKYQAPADAVHAVEYFEFGDLAGVESSLKKGDTCAVIIEGIQGLAGIYVPDPAFLLELKKLTEKYDALFVADEVQSGYGRSGKFFAHQYAEGVKPDMITMAKGMGNGFPIGGVLIQPGIEGWWGMSGTTFGGNHLAAAAGLAVLEIIEKEGLIKNTAELGNYFMRALQKIEAIKEVRGKGLMIGLEFEHPIAELRKKLIFEHHILTGVAANPNVLRLLPPLTLTKGEADYFIQCLKKVIQDINKPKEPEPVQH